MDNNAKETLTQMEHELGMLKRLNFTKQENEIIRQKLNNGLPLSENIYKYANQFDENGSAIFYKLGKMELNETERLEYVLLMQHKLLKTIKNCLLFFTVLTIISIIAGLIIALSF